MLILLVTAASARAGTLTFTIHGRPVTLALPAVSMPAAYDPDLDYDRLILESSLSFFGECLRASADPAHPTVTVPSWPALLGLSTRRAQFEQATAGLVNPAAGERAWFTEFSRRERLDFEHEVSFLADFGEHFVKMPDGPVNLRLLTRAAIISLGGGVDRTFIGWLQLETLFMAGHPFRTEHRRITRGPAPACANQLGDNVIPFRRVVSRSNESR